MVITSELRQNWTTFAGLVMGLYDLMRDGVTATSPWMRNDGDCGGVLDRVGNSAPCLVLVVVGLGSEPEGADAVFPDRRSSVESVPMMSRNVSESQHSVVMSDNEEEVGTRSQEGLIRGYTYPVTAVKRVQVGETSLRHLFKGEEGGEERRTRKTKTPDTPSPSTHHLDLPRPQYTRPCLQPSLKPPSTTIQWEHLTWDFEEILKQDSSKDEDMQPPPSNTHVPTVPLGSQRLCRDHYQALTGSTAGSSPNHWLTLCKEKLSMVRLIDARGEERKPFRPSSAVDERNTSVSNSNLNRVLSTNPDWTKMNDAQRERIGLTFDEEGEFWMPLEDFVSLFTELTFCRLLNINMFSLSQSWSEAVVRGAWSTGVHGSSEDRSGGCSSAFSGTFLRNPQFLLDVGVDGDELLIQLLQGPSDGEQNSVAMQSLLIGFSIIKVEENRKYRLHKLWDHTPVLVVCDPIRRRQIYYRGPIAQGRYILVPTAHKPGDEGPFLLRIFSSRDTKLR
uniref:Calpain catalytic domain-containing protein n=1 Tax=Timema cristinae TaxID=61476 RepID=A0A7R9H439_TIMCR|nr:unnamed protein product [Timema cristinae]